MALGTDSVGRTLAAGGVFVDARFVGDVANCRFPVPISLVSVRTTAWPAAAGEDLHTEKRGPAVIVIESPERGAP